MAKLFRYYLFPITCILKYERKYSFFGVFLCLLILMFAPCAVYLLIQEFEINPKIIRYTAYITYLIIFIPWLVGINISGKILILYFMVIFGKITGVKKSNIDEYIKSIEDLIRYGVLK